MPKDKRLNRGGTLGEEGELSEGSAQPERGTEQGPRGSLRDRLDHRDLEKQRGGIGREPDLDEKHEIQPTHQVD